MSGQTGLKPLVALYKTYRGGEWFGPSLESVYRHCVGAVVVTSDWPWLRAGGDNHPSENCREPLEKFQAQHPEFPVSIVRPGIRHDTEAQYGIGLSVIEHLYGCNHGVLIVDTDEVWEDFSLVALREAMTTDSRALYFRSGIFTYLRSPLYRVCPKESARPVVGLAHPRVPTGRSRFGNMHELGSGDQVRDVKCDMHHFGYVRLDPEEIIGKLVNTASQDRAGFRADWKQSVWDRLPKGRNIHPSLRFERCWGGVETVEASLLPTTVLQSDTFWATLSHHRDGVPSYLLLADNQSWRTFSERDETGIVTTVPNKFVTCLSAALYHASRGKVSQDDCVFLAPRLRMGFREVLQLAEHARNIPVGGKALEIGSGLGGSLSVIGSCAPMGTSLFAVDPFEPYDEENITLVRGTSVSTVEEFWETVDYFCSHISLLRMSSEKARYDWNLGSVDLLLVDGNHSYSHALFDLLAWFPLLKPGGILLLHDLSGRFPGVVRAAREFEEKTGLRFNLPLHSTLAWLRRLR